jgi:hypothetical protein
MNIIKTMLFDCAIAQLFEEFLIRSDTINTCSERAVDHGNWFPVPGPSSKIILLARLTRRGTGGRAASKAEKW